MSQQTNPVGEFTGTTAIVTGGSSGIGAAVAVNLKSAGASVVVLDVEAPTNHDLDWEECDVSSTASVNRAVEAAVSKLGDRLDIVINNAGIGAAGPVDATDDEEWHRVLDVNVVGIARVSRAAMSHLRASSNGAIVNVSSIAATAGLPDRAIYSASKGAVYSLTLAMAADLAREGIRVNCVCPGTVDTPWVGRLLDAAPDPVIERAALETRQPMGRLGTSDEVASAILFLASPANQWTTGAALAVDGGMQGLRLRSPE